VEEMQDGLTKKYIDPLSDARLFLVTVSCKTRKGINILQDLLIKLAASQEYIDQVIQH
jgi:hypothetical protein